MIDITGSWTLISSVRCGKNKEVPVFGDPSSGQIQYTADGRMSAFLQDPEWVGRGSMIAHPLKEFFAYAGRWSLQGNDIRHDIEFCSVPLMVNTHFMRRVNVIDDNRIELLTEPEIDKSGAERFLKLTWQRN